MTAGLEGNSLAGRFSKASAAARFLLASLLCLALVGGAAAQFTPPDAGDTAWSYNYGNRVTGVAVENGNVYAGGYQNSVVKLDSNGDEEWSYNYGDFVLGVAVENGEVYAGGFGDSVVKIDSNGNEEWSYNYGDIVYGVAVENGEVYAGGDQNSVVKLVFNKAPVFDSSSVSPDPVLIGENVSYSASASDSDGSITDLSLTVFKDGSQVFSDSVSGSSSYSWNDVYTPSSGGSLDARFTVTDDAGASTVQWLNRTLSNSAPDITINQPENGELYGNSTQNYDVEIVSSSDSYPDESIDYTVSVDGSTIDQGTQTGDFNLTGDFTENDGSTTFTVTADDGTNQTQDSVTFQIDTTAPDLNITHPTGKLDIKTNIDLNYTVSDASSTSCKYNIDGGTNISLSNCENTQFSVNEAGTHTVNLWATDAAGNTQKVSEEFTADYRNTVQLNDADTGSSIQEFQVSLQNGDTSGGSTENGTYEFFTTEMPKGDVNMTLRANGYQTRTIDLGNVDDTFELNQEYEMTRAGIYLDAVDEQTEENLQFSFVARNGTASYNQTNITEYDRDLQNVTDFPRGDVTLTVTHPDDTYRPRQYFLTVNDNTRTMLTARLLQRGQGLFTSVEVVDGEQNAVENALISVQRLYGTEWKSVVQKRTTSSGGQSFYLDPDISYRAYVSHPNYVSFQGTFSPANYQYEPLIIQLGSSDTYNFTTRWDSISYRLMPEGQTLEGEGIQQFNWTILDSQNDLTEFGVKFWHNGTKLGQDSVIDSPSGGTVTLDQELGNFSSGERVKVEGYFLTNSEYYSVNRTYIVRKGFDQGVFSVNAIFYELKQSLGELGESLVALIVTFLVVLGTTRTGFTNNTMDGGLALLVLGIFTWKEMFPGFIFILTLLLLVGLWSSRRV